MGNEYKDSHLVRYRQHLSDISGPGLGSRPKAHVVFRYYEQYHDGTTRDIHTVTFDKPIVQVFEHPGYVNIWMDFGHRDDYDLRIAWDILSEYSQPINSVSYLPEELESGYYTINGEKRMVYFPLLEVVLSPIGRESEFEIHALNPLFFTLSSSSPTSMEISVLQLTFDASWFQVADEMEALDIHDLRDEVMKELSNEMR